MKTAPRPKDDSNRRWTLMLALSLTLSVVCLGLVLFSPLLSVNASVQSVPVSMQSVLKADYSSDPLTFAIPAVGLNLIQNAIQDNAIASTDDPVRLSTVINDLLTAVPTVTPQGQPSQGPTKPVVVHSTSTPIPPQPTNPPRASATPQATNSAVPSATHTWIPPTATTRPTNPPLPTNTPQPTKPPVQPTNPPAPTNTPVPVKPTEPPPYPPPVVPTNPPPATPVPVEPTSGPPAPTPYP
jgi:hypothetical protein